ncbi:MAG: hypothetical protein U5L10_05295 [Candidatus Moranbacteria bacterium]|nr:hypothetical protein [Candidatus Moranbacteria bacterium]
MKRYALTVFLALACFFGMTFDSTISKAGNYPCFADCILQEKAEEVFGTELYWIGGGDFVFKDIYVKKGDKLIKNSMEEAVAINLKETLTALQSTGWQFKVKMILIATRDDDKEDPQPQPSNPKPSIKDEAHGCWQVSGFWKSFPNKYWGAEIIKKGKSLYKWKVVKRSGNKMCSYDSVKRSSPATGSKLDQLWGNKQGNFILWKESFETSGDFDTEGVFVFK